VAGTGPGGFHSTGGCGRGGRGAAGSANDVRVLPVDSSKCCSLLCRLVISTAKVSLCKASGLFLVIDPCSVRFCFFWIMLIDINAGDNNLFVPNLDAEDQPFFAGYHSVR
jgi:hypothetical protein